MRTVCALERLFSLPQLLPAPLLRHSRLPPCTFCPRQAYGGLYRELKTLGCDLSRAHYMLRGWKTKEGRQRLGGSAPRTQAAGSCSRAARGVVPQARRERTQADWSELPCIAAPRRSECWSQGPVLVGALPGQPPSPTLHAGHCGHAPPARHDLLARPAAAS